VDSLPALLAVIDADLVGVLLLLGRILLAVVFAFAGIAKLVNRTASTRAIAAFGAPASMVRPLGFLLPAAELAVAALLLPARSAWWGATGACVLLLTFIVAIAVNLLKGRTPDCQCFGQMHSQPIGVATLVRNALLAACAVPSVWAGRGDPGLSGVAWLRPVVHWPLSVLITSLGVCLAAAGVMFLLLQLFRQHGRLLVRMDALEQRLAGGAGPTHAVQPQVLLGLAVGTPAPSFTLSTLSGVTMGLDALLSGSKALLLVFSNPACQPCAALLPDIKRWQGDAADTVRVAVVSGGSEQATRSMTDPYALEDVLLEREREVAERYAVHGTPGAVLIRSDGTIGSPVAMGGVAIAGLFESAMKPYGQLLR